MKTAIAMTVLVAGATANSNKKPALINCGLVGSFMKESVTLTRDLTIFSAGAAASTAWGLVPADQQKVIKGQYDNVWDQVETLRIQNGIMKPSDIFTEIGDQYNTKVHPMIGKVYDMATKVAEKPFGFVKTFVHNFEKEYPAHAGLLSSISVWDFLLTVAFLVYFVIGYTKLMFCYVFCCGFCSKRKSDKPQLVKKSAPPVKANGVQKKR